MATVEKSAHTPASPSEVWAVLSDFAGISGWAPNVDHSCLLVEQTHGIGTVRRIQTGRQTVVETVVEWRPGEMLSYDISGLPPVIRSVNNTWRLTAVDSGTDVTLTSVIDAGSRPPQKGVARLVGRVLGAASEQMLGGLTETLAKEGQR